MYSGFSKLVAFFSLACAVAAFTIPPQCSLEHTNNVGRVFIGYNGFNGIPRPPQASGGGELGAVFYAVDLAKLFANGADHSKDYVCLIYADADEWARVPKVWVPAAVLANGGAAVNKYSPGSVVFAPHTNAGLPAGSPPAVFQLGIRQAQIARLQLSTDCRPKPQFANDHHTLNYPSLDAAWHIQRPFWLEEQWQELLVELEILMASNN